MAGVAVRRVAMEAVVVLSVPFQRNCQGYKGGEKGRSEKNKAVVSTF